MSLLLGVCWLWSAIWTHHPWRAVPGKGLLLALVVLDLFTFNARTNIQNRSPERQVGSSPLIETLQAAEGDQPFRVHHGDWYLMGNYGCMFDVEDTTGASQLHLADYARFVKHVPQERAWELLNVRYVVTWNAQLAVPSQVVYHTTTRQGEEVYLHRLENDAPRLWAVFQTEVISTARILERLSQPGFEPYSVALLDAPLAPPLAGQPDGQAQLHLTVLSAEHLSIEADMPARGLLILSELYYPGWKARVDGQRVAIRRVDAVLRAVEIPAGQHQIEMEFKPLSVRLGATSSLLTAILLLGYTSWVLASRQRGGGAPKLGKTRIHTR